MDDNVLGELIRPIFFKISVLAIADDVLIIFHAHHFKQNRAAGVVSEARQEVLGGGFFRGSSIVKLGYGLEDWESRTVSDCGAKAREFTFEVIRSAIGRDIRVGDSNASFAADGVRANALGTIEGVLVAA